MVTNEMTFEEYKKRYYDEVLCPRCKGKNHVASAIFPHMKVVCPVCAGKGWIKAKPMLPCDICDPIENPQCDRCLGS
jgi:DnaJ-class molecular chaperone